MLKNEVNPHINKTTHLPRKRFYRARAHSNPLSDSHFPVPIAPHHFDHSLHYPKLFPSLDQTVNSKRIQFADIGCGFGGLLVSLSVLFPETLMIGMELRDKVTEYVKERILALRMENPDVEELGKWMMACLEAHPMFEAFRDEECEADPVVKLLSSATEEGQKDARNGGHTFQAVYRRIIGLFYSPPPPPPDKGGLIAAPVLYRVFDFDLFNFAVLSIQWQVLVEFPCKQKKSHGITVDFPLNK